MLVRLNYDRIDLRGEYWRMLNRIILFQYLERLPVALIGGTTITALSWWVSKRKDWQDLNHQNVTNQLEREPGGLPE